jgi:mono/diheme cytochrome c family protein
MARPYVLIAAALLGLFSIGPQHGCRDLRRSATTLRYPGIRDMRRSVAIMPQKQVLLAPDSASVSLAGIDRDLGREVLAKVLVNPTPPADLAASIQRGEARFKVVCLPCHGAQLNGQGPVAAKFMPAADLLALQARQRADGYLYSYVRHGGLVMPAVGAQMTAAETWDVVNYVRDMQKVSPR